MSVKIIFICFQVPLNLTRLVLKTLVGFNDLSLAEGAVEQPVPPQAPGDGRGAEMPSGD